MLNAMIIVHSNRYLTEAGGLIVASEIAII